MSEGRFKANRRATPLAQPEGNERGESLRRSFILFGPLTYGARTVRSPVLVCVVTASVLFRDTSVVSVPAARCPAPEINHVGCHASTRPGWRGSGRAGRRRGAGHVTRSAAAPRRIGPAAARWPTP